MGDLRMIYLPFYLILIIVVPFIFSFIGYFCFYLYKGFRFKKGVSSRIMKHGTKIKRIYIDFPRRFILDKFLRDPDYFDNYGVHIVSGMQGSGKSITVCYLLLKYKKMYPLLKVKTNMNYKYEDGEINHWRDIVSSNNGIYGEINVIDEIQNWFSSLQSKDFPIDMLEEITQQRKQKKIIIGTTQVFNRTAKPLREQTYLLYEPHTLFGCLTFVFVYLPVIDDTGSVVKKKFRNSFFFVQNDILRESFDTYLKIEKIAKLGFIEKSS